jgi:hypothetical protein
VIRELRTEGHTSFMDRMLAEKRPTVRTVIQGYNYFVSGAQNSIARARGHLVIERLFQADLESIANDNGWNAGFIEQTRRRVVVGGQGRDARLSLSGGDAGDGLLWRSVFRSHGDKVAGNGSESSGQCIGRIGLIRARCPPDGAELSRKCRSFVAGVYPIGLAKAFDAPSPGP